MCHVTGGSVKTYRLYSDILSSTIITPTLDYRFDLKYIFKSLFHYFGGEYNEPKLVLLVDLKAHFFKNTN